MTTMMTMTNDDLFMLYQNTLTSDIEDNSFRAARINNDVSHRVGCSNEGYPMLFIECADKEKVLDIKLSLFRVLFNRECSLTDIDNKTISERNFTIVQMISNNQDLIKYFFQVMTLVLKRISPKPRVHLLKEEISKVIEIFTIRKNLSKEIIRGLWAELLIIEKSSNPEYLIRSWHEEPEDKYDFNDSMDKIEVKSTSGDRRCHVFSLEQLSPNENSKLIIASVFVNSVGIGKNIFDLVNIISTKIVNTDCSLKLMEIVLKTIGPHTEECLNSRYDYNLAVDTLRFYDYRNIPAINKESIPSAVSAVHFRSDLTDILPLDIIDSNTNSTLFNSL